MSKESILSKRDYERYKFDDFIQSGYGISVLDLTSFNNHDYKEDVDIYSVAKEIVFSPSSKKDILEYIKGIDHNSIIISLSSVSFSASEKINYPQLNWSFSGILGTFDRASQQRGLQVYKEVCSGCHGLRLLAYRNLKAIGYNDDEIKAFAAENSVNTVTFESERLDGCMVCKV